MERRWVGRRTHTGPRRERWGGTGQDGAGGVSTAGEDDGGSGAVWTRAAWQAWRGYGADGAGQGRVSHLVGKAERRGQYRAPHQQIAADAAPPLAQLWRRRTGAGRVRSRCQALLCSA